MSSFLGSFRTAQAKVTIFLVVGFSLYLAVLPIGVHATCVPVYELEPILPDSTLPEKTDGHWRWPVNIPLRLKAQFNQSCCTPGGPCSVSKDPGGLRLVTLTREDIEGGVPGSFRVVGSIDEYDLIEYDHILSPGVYEI